MVACLNIPCSSTPRKTNRSNKLANKVRRAATSLRNKATGFMHAQSNTLNAPPAGGSFEFKGASGFPSIATTRSCRSTTTGEKQSSSAGASVVSCQVYQPSICVTRPTTNGENMRLSLHVPWKSQYDTVSANESPKADKQVRHSHPVVSAVISPPPTPAWSVLSNETEASRLTVTPETLLFQAAAVTNTEGSTVSVEELQKLVEHLRLSGQKLTVVPNKHCNQDALNALEGTTSAQLAEAPATPEVRQSWMPTRPSTPRHTPIDTRLPSIAAAPSLGALLKEASPEYKSLPQAETPRQSFTGLPRQASTTNSPRNTLPPQQTIYVSYAAPFAPYGPTTTTKNNKSKSSANPTINTEPRTPAQIAESKRQSECIRHIEHAELTLPTLNPSTPTHTASPSARKPIPYKRRPYTFANASDDVFGPEPAPAQPQTQDPQSLRASPVRSISLPRNAASPSWLVPQILRPARPLQASHTDSSQPQPQLQLPTLTPTPTLSLTQPQAHIQRKPLPSSSGIRRSRLQAPLPPLPVGWSPLRRTVCGMSVPVEAGERRGGSKCKECMGKGEGKERRVLVIG